MEVLGTNNTQKAESGVFHHLAICSGFCFTAFGVALRTLEFLEPLSFTCCIESVAMVKRAAPAPPTEEPADTDQEQAEEPEKETEERDAKPKKAQKKKTTPTPKQAAKAAPKSTPTPKQAAKADPKGKAKAKAKAKGKAQPKPKAEGKKKNPRKALTADCGLQNKPATDQAVPGTLSSARPLQTEQVPGFACLRNSTRGLAAGVGFPGDQESKDCLREPVHLPRRDHWEVVSIDRRVRRIILIRNGTLALRLWAFLKSWAPRIDLGLKPCTDIPDQLTPKAKAPSAASLPDLGGLADRREQQRESGGVHGSGEQLHASLQNV